ncbi:hypothetical protein NUU61_004893 [Penicillium alfredii]|uniref:Uncharacterized protein n=1 Tax=Penicillium alfredii TaxID=1506179 RepID=A0A9W9K811_9EURO|nr:uncharacterized protein NUU61_004893 [Penicillium alfredii]KAJ5095537.1 hypothetical protein NUU61_004893 [Penicillium alfredii]
MGKPRMIILVRHAQSEGNKNREIHQTIPDHRVKLTAEGHRQAQEAGSRLRDLLRPDDTLHFFTSPYRRTRETTEGILESLTSDTPSPSPFPRHTIKVYEEPRLREQDFGNFQPCSSEMERMWMERADYGHFFYRIPNGESAADAYDRVSGFNESLWRLFGEQDFASVCILVTHGLMARVFLMKWYHWSVEYFEDLRNINHCEFVVLTHNPENGKYALQNRLRTWSDLRKERDLERNRERAMNGLGPTPITPSEHAPIRRKWGGCPDGCTHGMSADVKRSLRTSLVESMRHDSGHPLGKPSDGMAHRNGHHHLPHEHAPAAPTSLRSSSVPPESNEEPPRSTNWNFSSQITTPCPSQRGNNHQSDAVDGDVSPRTKPRDFTDPRPTVASSHPKRPQLHGLNRDSEDYLLHPPTSSSSSACLKFALLHLGGRDGGGSMSGANSLAPSDDEGDDQDHHAPPPTSSGPTTGSRALPHPRSESASHFHSPLVPHPQSQPPPPSQEFEDDGDDEMSANPTETSRRSRSHHLPHHHHFHHHHHHHHRQPHPHSQALPYPNHHHHHPSSVVPQSESRMTNILGDGDESQESPSKQWSTEYQSQPGYHQQEDSKEKLSLEAQQREDQSIRGSVY